MSIILCYKPQIALNGTDSLQLPSQQHELFHKKFEYVVGFG